MLDLKNIQKTYGEKNNSVVALKGVSISFRKSEFVSVLGPSGCGKTTLLNIIGGLDRYSNGDLVINGVSTKTYKEKDWDTYRNHSIGFVFQSYNLISNLTILENVELTMTLGGVSQAERKKRAKEALISVGLKDKLNKKPNELSGGQMQRVSIARALAGQPDIILADEPTGALDTETSESVMKLLKEISKTKLVIMVTHNPDLAYKYSNRIIKMLDGEIIDDSDAFTENDENIAASVPQKSETELKYKKKHSSMSLFTAFKLSAKNLLSKKKRTIITSLAASIGLIGIAVILSVSAGMQSYIDKTMLDSTSFNYISINATATKMTTRGGPMGALGGTSDESTTLTEYPENTTGIYPYEPQTSEPVKQKLDNAFISYLEEKSKDLTVDISYTYNVDMNILSKDGDSYVAISDTNWNECLGNTGYLAERYTVLASDNTSLTGIPEKATEIALVVDSYNRLSTSVLKSLGIAYSEDLSEIKYEDIIGKEFRIVFNDGWYTQNSDGWYVPANTSNYATAYDSEHGITVKIVSVLRENADAADSWLSSGIAYSPALTQTILDSNKDSAVAIAQAANTTVDVTTGKTFEQDEQSGSTLPGPGGAMGGNIGGASENENTYEYALQQLGYTQTPVTITIYPVDVNAHDSIIKILDDWNTEHKDTDEEIIYTDMSNVVTSMLGTVVNIVTYVLIAFSSVSLIISSIMIAIIIYASVIERTKEIGVLRSIGARKKDISYVFEAEAVLLGLISGFAAIVITLLINALINTILGKLAGVATIASLSVGTAFGIIGLSAVLLLIASLIPARIAAKKEPAVALRTE